jgi:Protein of unknown function (DUF3800)
VNSSSGVWLPKWLSFLSGLPEAKRRRKVLVPIQAFIDDSGGPDGRSKHLVLAAVITTAERWAAFSDEWEACLKETPALRTFKMKDAAGLSGQFFGRTAAQRDTKMLALAMIMNRYVEYGAVSGIDLEAFNKTLGTPGLSMGEDPYFYPFLTMIWGVTKFFWRQGIRERIQFIFDDQVIFGLRAKALYPAARHIFMADEPEACAILPVEPVFSSDDDSLPLQAADLCAWNFRYETENRGKPHPYDWLLPQFSNIKKINDTERYTADSVAKLMEMGAQLAANPTEALIKAQAGFREDTKHFPKKKPPRKKKKKGY